MAGIGARSKIYTGDEIVVIPAIKSAGVATIAGEVLYPFEQSGWGAAKVVYSTGNHSKVTGVLTFKTYISFDEGTTWDQTHSDVINAGSTVVASFDVPMAPRVRIDFVSDVTGALQADHGINIQIEFQENDPEAKRIFYGDSMGDSFKVAGDSSATAVNGSTITINSPNKLTIFMTADDISDVTNTLTWTYQASLDNSHWFNGDTITAAPVHGSGIAELASQEIITNLQKYARISVTGDTTADVTTLHGIKYYVQASE